MCFRKNSLFLFAFLSSIILPTASEDTYLQHFCINTTGNYTSNSIYQKNLNTLLSSLSSKVDEYGFYDGSLGENSDTVHANVLCKGDVKLDLCHSCISNSTIRLLKLCPDYKDAIIWYENCTLRYSSEAMTGIMSDSPNYTMWNGHNVISTNQFNQTARNLLESLSIEAASGGSRRKFAMGNVPGPDYLSIFALVQCTPDLSVDQCSGCLQGEFDVAVSFIKIGGRIYRPSCRFRYEISRFYDDTPANAPPSDTALGGKKNDTARTAVFAVVPTIGFLILLLCVLIFARKRKQKKQNKEIEIVKQISSVESFQYDLDTIRKATGDFSDANKLGQGGFGDVYRGKLPSGQQIAVKRLSPDSNQGEVEFKNEVVLMAKLQHRNLVKLLGFCLEGTERLLIYEFVINSSLDNFIFDPVNRTQLDWEKRHKIIGGIAKGLVYLHEDSRLRIIHRDLKASNILLDAEMNPKIADFGIARLIVVDETHWSTHRIIGTRGYMAPEYAIHGHFSVKSDVFSFGVLILEIVSGRKNRSTIKNEEQEEDLLSYAWRSWRNGTGSDLIDPALRGSTSNLMPEMLKCVHIGLICVQGNVADRPTMALVVLMLGSSYDLILPVPTEPRLLLNNANNFNNDCSANEQTISSIIPR